MSNRVAIVGAGISGMSAAYELQKLGIEATVFEAGDRAGGILSTADVQGYRLERAASSFVPADHGAHDLAVELGVEVEEANPEAKKRWVFVGGQLVQVPMGPGQLVTTDLMSWRGKFRVFAEPLKPTQVGADESIADFCRRRLGPELTDNLVAPFVVGVFGGNAEELSLKACFPKLAALEARGGLVRGLAATKVENIISRLQGAKTSKKGRRILAPVGGLEKLTTALAAKLEGQLRLSTAIARFERSDRGYRLHDAEGNHHEVDALLLCAPAQVSAALVEPHHAGMAEALRAIPYAPMAVLCLGFDAKAVEHPLDGFGFLRAPSEDLRLLGAVFESSVWSGRAPEGKVMVRCMLGGALDPEIVSASDQELIAAGREGLSRALGIRAEPEMVDLRRWPRAIPQYTLGHLDRVKTIEAGADELGIFVGGNPMRGVSLNDCIHNGKRMAKSIIDRLSGVAMLTLVALALASGACGGQKSSGPSSSGKDGASLPASEPADAALSVPVTLEEPGRGLLELRATWPWPPAELRRSPGPTSCASLAEPPLKVELMGGLQDVAISAATGQAPERARVLLRDCRFAPRVSVVSVGGELVVHNGDEAGHELVVERLGEKGEVSAAVGTLPMRVVGHQYALPVETAGLFRFHSKEDPSVYGYVLASQGAAVVTNSRGVGELELEEGERELTLWHPPVPGHPAGLRKSAVYEVVASTRSKHDVALN